MENIRFCQKMMTLFEIKNMSILNLVIALAGNQSSHSPTELSLNQLYNYQYSSISDAVDAFLFHKEKKDTSQISLKIDTNQLEELFKKEAKLQGFLKEFFPQKFNNKFWLLNSDVVSIYREHSPTLENKEFVYAANTVIKGNKPVTIGLRLSCIGISARENHVAWNPPVSMLRIPPEQKSNAFVAQQIKVMMVDQLLFDDDLVVNDLDSAFCNVGYAYPTNCIPNLVSIIRIAGHRNVFHSYRGETKTGKGAKNKYGNIFKLPDSKTHTQPDQTDNFEWTLKKGRKCNVHIKQWNNMIIKGKRNKKMYNKPFNLVSIQLTDIQTGNPIFDNTLWLTVWGERRNEITLGETYQSYRNRFDIEGFFRFGKQKLLLDKYQTPDIQHQQNWFWIVMLAYWLLYLSRKEGENIIRTWEKYDAKYKNQDVKELENNIVKTPTQTQRTMQSIFCDFAKNNLIPKPRNICSGRIKGQKQTPRKHFKVVKKGVNLKI